MRTFLISILLWKNATPSLATRYVLTNKKKFQMRCCMKFFLTLKGHQNYKKTKSKDTKKIIYVNLESQKFDHCIWYFLMPPKIKLHSKIPHLKISIVVKTYLMCKGLGALLHTDAGTQNRRLHHKPYWNKANFSQDYLC